MEDYTEFMAHSMLFFRTYQSLSKIHADDMVIEIERTFELFFGKNKDKLRFYLYGIPSRF